ncbi:ferrous iron transport protein B [Candidatus Thioglobus autotrophicus]|uniref:ferrous iron transport protein B n=1 Tax=Candidatus Thioglobus autotrophicus TaxID=1705394 RepID=UPI0006B69756|nr:ferrous iron transport protein B [Candidatus Thioglobus autotrophicus]
MSFEKIALIGNPNAGKTTLFNLLTGAKQRTGNWPGVTVERKEGEFYIENQQFSVTDLPGVYSIDDKNSSIDEQIARDFVLNNPDHLYFNIVDASTLERGLYLTTQLRELGVNVVVLLNMMDVVAKRDMQIDVAALKGAFACEVIPVSLKGAADLTQLLESITHYQPLQAFNIEYPIKKITDLQGDHKAIELLEAETRFNRANSIAQAVTTHAKSFKKTLSDTIDHWILGAWTGVPIFLTVIYLLFLFSINFGGALIDFFDIFAGVVFVEGTRYVLDSIGTPEFMQVILADGVGGGIQVVATFIPIIASLYLFLTLLEEVGYMARAAFVMDKFMRRIGLSGKAFIPLIVGFGCNVPGIMAARTLDTHRERVTTVMMSPFMSCGARLAVYALFAAAFFPVGGQNIVFSLYLIGVMFAILTGLILKRAFKGGADTSDFLMELPGYQLPSFRNLGINTWNKLKGFVLGAGKVIVIVVTLINVVNSVGMDGSFGNQNSKNSALSALAQTITPVFEPMGIDQDNWPATVGIVTGILAKEVVVGTLDSLYSNLDVTVDANEIAAEYDLVNGVSEALATIPVNIAEAVSNISDPLGLSVLDDTHSQDLAAESQAVSADTFGVMVSRFDGKIGAFAYLLFILLYFPCVAAFGAMTREVGKKWAIVGALWATGLAYFSATVFYQIGTFSQHPMHSLLWIGVSIVILIISVMMLMTTGSNASNRAIPVVTETECHHCK